MWEYKVIVEEPMVIQKLLNQWRHQFDIFILEMTTDSLHRPMVLLKRRPKEFNNEAV